MTRFNERGASAVEFALVLPVLMLILFGSIEFGMVMYSREVLTNASREGARSGIVQQIPKPSIGEIQNVVTNYLSGTGINVANVIINVSGAGGVFPNDLTVSVSYPYQFFAPGIMGLGSSITLNTRTVMRHE
jgi:Flp pilus assembly protein TadG